MTTKYASKKLSFFVAEQFNESFFEPEPTSVGYVFLGNHLDYPNEPTPEEISESVLNEKKIWRNIFAARKITGSDISLVLPYKLWTLGKVGEDVYKQYDDNIEPYDNSVDFYVVNRENQVYKCLSNNNGAPSTIEPFGDYSVNDGIVLTDDGYIWKYMYRVPANSIFFTKEDPGRKFMPVPVNSANASPFTTSTRNLIDGAIYSIVVENSGSNYRTPKIQPVDFPRSTNIITLTSVTGLAENMLVEGLGIPSGPDGSDTFVTKIDNFKITLSKNTNASVVGTGNTLTFFPRVEIVGDGTGAKATANVTSANTIDKITMSTYGINYSFANVIIYGSGTSAKARAVIGPKLGHGNNPAEELGANAVMIAVKIGDGDSTENGLISNQTTFRQYGFLRDPHKYGNGKPVNFLAANTFISQTYNITLVAGPLYEINEFVYQGSLTNPTFYGYVNSQSSSVIRLTGVVGKFQLGASVTGKNSGVSRNAVLIQYPEFEPFTGDILYVENVPKIQRTDNQVEILRFVLTF